MDKEITIHQILDALSGGDIDLERKVKLLYCNVEAMHRGVKLIHLAMNCEIEQFRQNGIEIPKSPTKTMDKQSPSPEFDFLMTPPRLSGHQLLKIWMELRKEFWSSPEEPDKDSPEWKLYRAITQRFTDDASLLKECFVTLADPNNE